MVNAIKRAMAAVAVLFTSCASHGPATAPAAVYNLPSEEKVKVHYFVSLNNLKENPQFTKADNSFMAASGRHKISVKSNLFESKKQAQAFLLSRRTYLHQAYSTLIAPYFGVVKADAECMKLVDVTGDLKKQPDSESVAMTFVADESENLVDCYSQRPVHTVKYFLKLCYKVNTVFEVKLINKIGAAEPVVTLQCD